MFTLSKRSKKIYLNFFIFSMILITANVVIDFLFFANDAQKVALQNGVKKIKEREKVLKDFIMRSDHGLHSLSKNEFFLEYLEDKSKLRNLQEVFLTFSKAHNIFMQLRYIDKDGLERVRVDRNSLQDRPFIVPEDKLQNKASRYYFKDSITKPLEQVWFSALDLNIENGKVQVPYVPTLRAMLPINHNGEFGGIIIINYFMDSFLKKFLNMSLYDSILYDNQGYILHDSNNKVNNWSFYNENKKVKIQDIYPEHEKELLSTNMFIGDTYTSNKLYIPTLNNLHLLVRLKQAYLNEQWVKQVEQYALVATITFIISLFIAGVIARRFNQLLDQLEEKSNALESANKNLELFVDTQDNIVILTDGKELTFANKRFFKFFNYENLEKFKTKHECICEFFIENDRFFHLGKISEEENWVEVLQTMPHSQRLVSMMGDDFKIHAFSVTINRFNEETLIVSFTDISQTMLEHIKLEKKTIHDKLTGAYNREYFEQNYRRLINEYHTSESVLALAVLDIDHFKQVNDLHGHDAGDEVLIHFVKTVKKFSRKDDLFIRWGGEEFILLLKVKSEEDLEKALEHLRKVIELHQFPIVGQKTSSIGGTIYKASEDIYTTIKRADEAVYDAKAAGRNRVIIK